MPVTIEAEERRTVPVGLLDLRDGYAWFDLESEHAPRLRLADEEGHVTKTFDLRAYGYRDAKALRAAVAIEDGRTFGPALGERTIASIDAKREFVRLPQVAFPMADGGRLVLVRSGANAPRLERRGPAETAVRLSLKEFGASGSLLEERIVSSPSGAFRARVRRWASAWGRKTPIGYVTLIGRREVAGKTVDIELSARNFYGKAPREIRVFDDGRVATLECDSARAFLALWNLGGSSILGIDLAHGWYPDPAAVGRGFHLANGRYRASGNPTTFTVEGVSVPEWPKATWTLPLPNGKTRTVRLRRGANGTRASWRDPTGNYTTTGDSTTSTP